MPDLAGFWNKTLSAPQLISKGNVGPSRMCYRLFLLVFLVPSYMESLRLVLNISSRDSRQTRHMCHSSPGDHKNHPIFYKKHCQVRGDFSQDIPDPVLWQIDNSWLGIRKNDLNSIRNKINLIIIRLPKVEIIFKCLFHCKSYKKTL